MKITALYLRDVAKQIDVAPIGATLCLDRLASGANLHYVVDDGPGTTWARLVDSKGKVVAGDIDQGQEPRCYPGKSKPLPKLAAGAYVLIVERRDAAGKVTASASVPMCVSICPTPAPQPAAPPPISLSIGQNRPLHIDERQIPELVGADFRWVIWWNFGDQSRERPGFNAAHVFDHAGVYQGGVRWIDADGKSGSRAITFNVPADARTVVNAVSLQQLVGAAKAGGKFINYEGPALDIAAPIEVGPDTFILLHDVKVNGRSGRFEPLFHLRAGCVLRGGNFDNPDFDAAAKNPRRDMPFVVRVAEGPAAVQDCTYRNISGFINGDNSPVGVLIEGVGAQIAAGLRTYFGWVQGGNWCFYDNTVLDSWYEHGIRCGGATRVVAHNNSLSNQDLTAQGYVSDIAKGNFVGHLSEKFSIVGNRLLGGPLGIGPLPGADGAMKPGAATASMRTVQILDNVLRGGSRILIQHGSIGVFIDGTDGALSGRQSLIDVGGEDHSDYYWDKLARKWVSKPSAGTQTYNYRRPDGTYRRSSDIVLGPQAKLVNGGGSKVTVSSTAYNVSLPASFN